MSDAHDLTIRIIEELTRLQDVPCPYPEKNGQIGIPRIISAGDRGSLVVSQELDDAILMVARKLIASDPALRRKFTHAEWHRMVRNAFGP